MRPFAVALLLTSSLILSSQAASAQETIDQTDSALTGSTTEGISGLTTEGLDSISDTGGIPGANAAQEFIGATNPDGLVGGVRETTENNTVNRLFRAITGQEVPTGDTRSSTGKPRRVPVSLRLGFEAPTPHAVAVLAGPDRVSLDRYHVQRPELAPVSVLMDDDGVVTLAGTVAEASTRRLAGNLIRLQPGVRQVRNQITVRPRPGVRE